jgi:glycosyltransferase involved in cell wall biosynthesis
VTPPLISVVMPVWNGERYLAEAIESVLAQTYSHFELVIVDDGSEDRSGAIIARYADSDARVRPIYAAHRTLVPTLNTGCEAAQGRYIARMDGDDIALPERLDRQVTFLESHPEVALVATAVQLINAAGERRPIITNPPSENAGIRQALMRANCFCHSSVMMRTGVLTQIGGYRPLYIDAEDYDLWTRFADTHELACISDALVLYRIHPRQVSLTRLEQQALVALAIRLSTQMRWSTGVDPLAECDVIDRSTVRALGVSDEEIDSHVLNAYLRCLATMPSLGLGKVALEAVRDVAAQRSLLSQLDAIPAGSL